MNKEEVFRSLKLHSGKVSKRFYKIIIIVSGVLAFCLLWVLFSGGSTYKFNFPIFKREPFKSTDGRINVLLLGIAGGNHDGPNLTDSIIVASYSLKTKKVVLFSVPRDLWLDNIKEKVNVAYQMGLDKGMGLKFAEDKIDDILGINIHYGLRVDFRGFAKAVDLVDGIDLVIPKTFDDYNYPAEGKENESCGLAEKEVDLKPEEADVLRMTPGKRVVWVRPDGTVATKAADFSCRFEYLHFDTGFAHLNGSDALKFVRSRMGTNDEGSDFARSRRQQIVLEAFRKKVLSIPTLSNPQKIIDLISTFSQSVETDIPKERFIDFYNLAKDVKQTENIVLGDLGEGKSIFVNPPVASYGAWVLIPKDNDLRLISDFVKAALIHREVEIEKQPSDKK